MAQEPCKLVSRGDVLDYLASSDKAAGDVVLIGSRPLIVDKAIDYSENPLGTAAAKGVWDVPQKAETIAAGTLVYWDATGDPVGGTAGTGAATAVAGSNKLMGVAAGVQSNGTNTTAATDTHVRVLLEGTSVNIATVAGSMTADDITGSDAALSITGIAGSSGAGGTVPIAGGAGDTDEAGGAVSLTGGAGDGTGNGGASSVVGGAGGTTGAGGAVSIVGGASAGAGGTAGAASIDAGAATGGTGAGVTIGGTNATFIAMGKMPIVPAASVAAAGSAQGDAAAIATGITWVTGANAMKGVKLPAAAAGLICIVKNDDTANAVLKVYPNTDDTINALAANAALSMAAKTACLFACLDGTAWFTVPLLPS